MPSSLTDILTFWIPLGYFLVFFLLLFEGESVLFAAAFLTHRGIFKPIPMLFVVVAAVLIGDFLWYCLGRYHNKLPRIVNYWLEKFVKPFDHHLQSSPLKTLFISKFVYGFCRSVLVRAGQIKLPLNDFLKANIPSSLVWIVIIGGLGYGTSTLFVLARHYLKITGIALLAGLVLFLLISHLAAHKFKKML